MDDKQKPHNTPVDLELLQTRQEGAKCSDAELEALRQKVSKMLKRHEKEKLKKRRAELERLLYELDLHA